MQLRLRLARAANRLLTSLLPNSWRHYRFADTATTCCQHPVDELRVFMDKHGYFASQPLVGTVTDRAEDVEVTRRLLERIPQVLPEGPALFATLEVMVKVLAFRALKQGSLFSFFTVDAHNQPRMIVYSVDKVFNLWHQMPAYGFMPAVAGEAPPLLLFRGTDLSGTKRGLASVLSDLDFHGVGFSAFHHARPRLDKWLKQVASQGCKARALGYSLGGNLAAYTVLYENEWLHDDIPSVGFNSPGVGGSAAKLTPTKPLTTYVVEGDPTSKIGQLKGDLTLLSVDEPLGAIEAHVAIISAAPHYYSRPMTI